jgi:hypothetical protein
MFATHLGEETYGKVLAAATLLVVVYAAVQIWRVCPEKETSAARTGYKTPFTPGWPCAAIFVNWYLIAQLELVGIGVLLLYMALVTLFYRVYSMHHSVIGKQVRGAAAAGTIRMEAIRHRGDGGSNAEGRQLLLGSDSDVSDSDDSDSYADQIVLGAGVVNIVTARTAPAATAAVDVGAPTLRAQELALCT